jgi:hypothetical protein
MATVGGAVMIRGFGRFVVLAIAGALAIGLAIGAVGCGAATGNGAFVGDRAEDNAAISPTTTTTSGASSAGGAISGEWITVKAGYLTAVGITKDGSLWAWGGVGLWGPEFETAIGDHMVPPRISRHSGWVAAQAAFGGASPSRTTGPCGPGSPTYRRTT